MSLIEQLEESEDYQKVKTLEPVHKQFENLLDQDTQTRFIVQLPDKESEVYNAELYTEINEHPYWISSHVTDREDLVRFRRNAEDALVTIINAYEES